LEIKSKLQGENAQIER